MEETDEYSCKSSVMFKKRMWTKTFLKPKQNEEEEKSGIFKKKNWIVKEIYLLWMKNEAKWKFYVVNNENIFSSWWQTNFPNDSEKMKKTKKKTMEERKLLNLYFTMNFGPKTNVGNFIKKEK